MNFRVSFFIGFRYFRHQWSNPFARLMAGLSIVGIALGVAALILVTSLMNGLRNEIGKNLLKFFPQTLVRSPHGPFVPDSFPLGDLLDVSQLQASAPLVSEEVIVRSKQAMQVVTMLGVLPEAHEPLREQFSLGRLDQLTPGGWTLALGQSLARALEVGIGDEVRVMVPSVPRFGVIGNLLSQRIFRVSGIFVTGTEVDSTEVLMHILDAGRLLQYRPSEIGSWRLFFSDPIHGQLKGTEQLKKQARVETWMDKKGALFEAILLERLVMFCLIGMIVLIAGFQGFVSLGLQVLEKASEIAVLMSQGMTQAQIAMIFWTEGLLMGGIGILTGLLSGLMLTTYIDPVMRLLRVGSLLGAHWPVAREPQQIGYIVLFSVVIIFVATAYPAFRARALDPAKVLRNE